MVVAHANAAWVGEHAPNLMLSHTGVRRGQMTNDAIGQLYVPDRVHVSTAGCGLPLIFKDADLGHATLLEMRVNSSLFSATWQLHMAPIYDRLINNKINVKNWRLSTVPLWFLCLNGSDPTSTLILRKQSLIDAFLHCADLYVHKRWLQPCKVTSKMISTLSQ